MRATTRKLHCDRAPDTARSAGNQCDSPGERSRPIIAISFCNVCHFYTPVFRIAPDNRGIDPHNHVTPNRTGAEAGREHPHRPVYPALAYSVMDGHENTRGGSVADPFYVEENPLARYPRSL